MRGLCCALLLASTAVACGPAHIKPHVTRERAYEPGDYGQTDQPMSDGSLWPSGGISVFGDFRASRVGDVVTIVVDENPNASGDAATELSKETSANMGVTQMLGLTQALQRAHPDLDPTQLLSLAASNEFSGAGSTTRGSRVQASITVRVKRQLPNGDLFVEGSKVLLVNDEELHIYTSGVIRPQDILQDNTVSSSLIADAQIEFTGRGVLTETQSQGWLTRLISKLNPF